MSLPAAAEVVGSPGYIDSMRVERVGMAILLPWFRARAEKVKWLSGANWQRYGDFAVCKSSGSDPVYVEAKHEQDNPHGNFFLETWSNKPRGVKGWMHSSKCEADVLAYYFIKPDTLFMLDLSKLREHVWPKRKNYREIEQTKNAQPNGTYGLLVPISEAMKAAGKHRVAMKPGAWRDSNTEKYLANQTAEEWSAEYEGLPD